MFQHAFEHTLPPLTLTPDSQQFGPPQSIVLDPFITTHPSHQFAHAAWKQDIGFADFQHSAPWYS